MSQESLNEDDIARWGIYLHLARFLQTGDITHLDNAELVTAMRIRVYNAGSQEYQAWEELNNKLKELRAKTKQ